MSLFKRKGSPYWWIKITHNGRSIQKSARTTDEAKASDYHDKLKPSLWDQERLGIKPRYSWQEAVIRYLAETSSKASNVSDRIHLRWLDRYLSGLMLDEINRDMLEKVMAKRIADKVANSTVNRTMEVVRAVLRKAAFDWEWLERVPRVRMLPKPKRRIRWITKDEAERLIRAYPLIWLRWCDSR